MEPYILAPLPYEYGALEPYLDARNLEIHHAKHHQAYVDSLNKTLSAYPHMVQANVFQLLRDVSVFPKDMRQQVINFGGGHANHTFFWSIMTTPGNSKQGDVIVQVIEKTFGSFQAFKEQFSVAAKSVFGSGWAWLVYTSAGELHIMTTANQDSPISLGYFPLLCLDVWEHAYYLQYQNRRVEFIDNWWQVVNWQAVETYYHRALTGSL
jgi:superoxide dismutase, Fe-Mn family